MPCDNESRRPRLLLVGCLLSIAACGVSDNRPKNLESITASILRPQCAAAPCHSAFRQWVGDEYDTVATARTTLYGFSLVPVDVGGSCGPYPAACDTDLIRTLTVGLTSYVDATRGKIRMPYDAPLANGDLALIQDWLADGWDATNSETHGLGPLGVQCDPTLGATSCSPDNTAVYGCTSDGNLNPFVSLCPNGCLSGACK